MAIQLRPYIAGAVGTSIVTYPDRDLSAEPPFGRWSVLRFVGRNARGTPYWLCRCVCGTERATQQSGLISGGSISCGCLKVDATRKRCTTHGKSRIPEYAIWNSMVQRCYCKKVMGYCNYGGRGITVCSRWRRSIDAFLEDMGPRPSPKHQIDRFPDNNGNYEPGNCRWVTGKQNCNNRRNNHKIEHNGQTMTLTEWAESVGMRKDTLRYRISRLGWSIEAALGTPTRHRSPNKKQPEEPLGIEGPEAAAVSAAATRTTKAPKAPKKATKPANVT